MSVSIPIHSHSSFPWSVPPSFHRAALPWSSGCLAIKERTARDKGDHEEKDEEGQRQRHVLSSLKTNCSRCSLQLRRWHWNALASSKQYAFEGLDDLHFSLNFSWGLRLRNIQNHVIRTCDKLWTMLNEQVLILFFSHSGAHPVPIPTYLWFSFPLYTSSFSFSIHMVVFCPKNDQLNLWCLLRYNVSSGQSRNYQADIHSCSWQNIGPLFRTKKKNVEKKGSIVAQPLPPSTEERRPKVDWVYTQVWFVC